MGHPIKDSVYYENVEYEIDESPLMQYLELNEILFVGYFASYEIKENKLFLVNLQAGINPDDGTLFTTVPHISNKFSSKLKEKYPTVGIEYLFPNEKEVFAEWFTGEIILPHGKLLNSTASYNNTLFQEEMHFTFEKGIVTNSKNINNLDKLAEHELKTDPYKDEIARVFQLKSQQKYFEALNFFANFLLPTHIEKIPFRDFLQIKRCFKKASKIDEDNAMIYFYMGVIYTTQNKMSKAEKLFQKAENIGLKSAVGCKNIGHAYYGMGETWYNYGMSSERTGNTICMNYKYDNKAIEFFQKSLEFDDNDADSYMYYKMGNLFLNSKEHTQALRCYQRAFHFGITDLEVRVKMSENYYKIGIFFFELGDSIMAKACCQNAIRINPNNSLAYNGLGCVFMHKKNLEEATRLFLKSIDLDSENDKPYHNISLMLKDSMMELLFTKKAAQLGDKEDQEFLKEHGYTWYGKIGNIKELLDFLRDCDNILQYLKSPDIDNTHEKMEKDNISIANGTTRENSNIEKVNMKNFKIISEGYGEFGHELTNPIPMHSIPESYLYLRNLTTLDGVPVTYRRTGSKRAPNIIHPIDEYQIFANQMLIATIYIYPYYCKNAEIAPKGLHLATTKYWRESFEIS
jgi:tetratricopeptide (TPR) repeat protein